LSIPHLLFSLITELSTLSQFVASGAPIEQGRTQEGGWGYTPLELDIL